MDERKQKAIQDLKSDIETIQSWLDALPPERNTFNIIDRRVIEVEQRRVMYREWLGELKARLRAEEKDESPNN